MSCLRSLDLMLRSQQIVVSLLDLETGAPQLSFQLRDFKHRECLTLMYPVSDVDVDLYHEARDFGVNVNDLVRLELPGKAQCVGKVSPLRRSHLGRGYFIGFRLRAFLV